ncbi:Uncharacterised protein [Citrobacter freundii]|nr:Uncharacterised protein [Citrobacter freundii]
MLASSVGASNIGETGVGTVQDFINKTNSEYESVDNIISPKIGVYGRTKGAKYSIYNEVAWDSSDRINDKLNPSHEFYYRIPQIIKLPSGTMVIFFVMNYLAMQMIVGKAQINNAILL